MRRSLLFLPGNNPNMLMNGGILGADTVILDLEDAVAPDEKDAARVLVRNALQTLDYGQCEICIRINAVDENDYWKNDLEELVPLRPALIMPTKVSSAEYIRQISKFIDEVEIKHGMKRGTVHLLPLLETCLGLENAYAIATASERVDGLFLGAEDLTADMHCVRTKEGSEISYARSRIVTAARAANVEVYDTPFTDVYDDDGLIVDAKKAKSMGFSGKASISPRHVKEINKVFSPTPQEVKYAYEVLEAIEHAKAMGKGAISLYGKMIDKPIVTRAKQVIEMDQMINGGSKS